MKRLVVLAAALVCAWPALPRAIDLDVGVQAIEDAITLGQSRLTSERDRFHAAYRIPVAKPPVDYIDIVTPFRRVVLAAQAEAEIGNRRFGQREAVATLAAMPDIVELYVELTFHPLNTYVGVPDYHVTLVRADAGAARLEPQSMDRIPRYGPRVDGLPLPHPRPTGPPVLKGTQPMLGGTVIARYDGQMLDASGSYDVVISEEGMELARTRVDLGKLR